ncbi:hypothetical protein B5F74_02240 [Collinsella sp. An271]|uniref:hypothetical protein n=1 Tax=Collinsella sp. An271 TaxID=1965616 RepID=UPI000B3A5152|nr:hypothetical protein [Collinsella sp. An271]OUO62051.1 hypothetical protein B5F74_02240 [Collinsella sp. An271]
MISLVDAVAGVVKASGVRDVYVCAPSALLCSEPVVVRWRGFTRESRQPDEERGVAELEVLVVRDEDLDAARAASACERALRAASREDLNESLDGVRVLGVDTCPLERVCTDRSGRAVWRVRCLLTVAREM